MNRTRENRRRRRRARWTNFQMVLTLLALAALATGCASAPPVSPVPCSRVSLEPAPPWTASAAWNVGEDQLVLVDPGSKGLATYGRDGRRIGEASLEGAGIDYSEPMRFERSGDGYVLVGKRRVVRLNESLAVERLERPFASLEGEGFTEASLNDAVVHDGVFHGYADFVDTSVRPPDDPEASGTWRRGFVRLDPAAGELRMLHELPLDSADGEFASYYLYDRRPYVARLGGKIYALRFTEPWSVHRMTARGLRQIAAGDAADEGRAAALQAWNGRLYVLTSRVVPEEKEDEPEVTAAQLKASSPTDARVKMVLEKAMPVAAVGKRQWTLHEIDPRGGSSRRLELPTMAERLRLVPGRAYWTAIEETTSPNIGQEGSGTSFLFLPASEIVAGELGCRGS
ncbi:MAG: hypothetical protein GY719_16795 [bacterium]|nr:hypothetical protein [bacterium]